MTVLERRAVDRLAASVLVLGVLMASPAAWPQEVQ